MVHAGSDAGHGAQRRDRSTRRTIGQDVADMLAAARRFPWLVTEAISAQGRRNPQRDRAPGESAASPERPRR
jgi:hypothetical protein